MQRVLITGATGLVGKAIVKQCHDQNIAVNYLTTRKDQIVNLYNYQGFYWSPEEDIVDINCFKDVDVIINLAGATVAKKWTKAYKEKILTSRLNSLSVLYKAIKDNKIPIRQFVSASAIGIYPDSQMKYYEEDEQTYGDSFLAEVVNQWEQEVVKFESMVPNVAIVRIGIVLDANEGALPKLVKPIKAFVGAPLGNGGQWQSWIHIDDLSRIFLFIVQNNLKGIYNGVAPNPVIQKELVKQIASVLKRPIWLPKVPEFMLKLLLGEMSALVLESQRVSAKKLENLGFNYTFNYARPALEDLLIN